MELRFDHDLPASLSAADLWRELETVFEDSSRSRIWPDHLSHISSAGLKEGEEVHVTYRIGPLKSRAVYHVRDLVSGQRFRYVTGSDHPLSGGAALSIEPAGNGSVLHWHGAYRLKGPGSLIAAGFFKLWFERVFFQALARKLRRPSQLRST